MGRIKQYQEFFLFDVLIIIIKNYQINKNTKLVKSLLILASQNFLKDNKIFCILEMEL